MALTTTGGLAPMAATQNLRQLPESHNSGHELIMPRHGVVTLFGYGIQVRVDRGHLLLEDGIGPNRRSARLPRVRHGLKRLVIIGSDGFVSLSALRWLADQQVSFILLERDGTVLTTTGPVRPSDVRLRRAQALAVQWGAAIGIARELIDHKLIGQERVARHKLLAPEIANQISRCRNELAAADTIERIRLIESQAAGSYWSAWHDLPINFPRKDALRLPDHWRVFGTRVSPLTGSPRLAVNPPNAILNYLYAVLESECRLAAIGLGLDPGFGLLHADAPARDNFIFDLIEPVRPHVDAYLLNWITSQPFKREWFFEQSNGNCRLLGSFAVRLSETAPTWGRAVAPFAERVAQRLWDTVRKPARERTLPTRLTQRRRSEGRGNEFVPAALAAPYPQKICPGCGATTQRGRLCPTCGREVSREKLIELAKMGRIAAQRPESQVKHAETQRRHQAAKREWLSSPKPSWPTETTYIEKIQPALATVPISRLSSTLGVSESYAADIRAGRHRPHPRHWRVLEKLGSVSSDVKNIS
jgi:CRISPR-associated endonuclease Cas1